MKPCIRLIQLWSLITLGFSASFVNTLRQIENDRSNRIALRPRKATDPYISCFGWGPDATSAWPEGLNEETYATLVELCAASGGQPRNLGFICDSSTSEITANLDRQDAELAQMECYNLAGDATVPLTRYCQMHCTCTANREHSSGDEQEDDHSDIDSGAQPDSTDNESGQRQTRPYDVRQYIRPPRHRSPWGRSSQQAAASDTCGTQSSCSSSRQCSRRSHANTPATKACQCKTTSSTYEPQSGVMIFKAACLSPASLSIPGGKRSIDIAPCVCNSTYVSHGCCDSIDGFIWEDPGLNLGIVNTLNETAV